MINGVDANHRLSSVGRVASATRPKRFALCRNGIASASTGRFPAAVPGNKIRSNAIFVAPPRNRKKRSGPTFPSEARLRRVVRDRPPFGRSATNVSASAPHGGNDWRRLSEYIRTRRISAADQHVGRLASAPPSRTLLARPLNVLAVTHLRSVRAKNKKKKRQTL